MMDRLADRCMTLGEGAQHWRALGLAAALGAAAVLALPPFYLLPLLIVAVTPLVWLLEGAARRPRGGAALSRAAWLGWGFGIGFFAAGTYWIGEAFLVDMGRTGWLTPFAVAGVALGLALFSAAAAALAVFGWRVLGLARPGRVSWFAAAWVLLEWLRGWILTGFPWNLLGTVWAATLPMAQMASVTGVYGLSLVTVLAAAAPSLLAADPGHGAAISRRQAAAVSLALTVVLPVAVAVAGAAHLAAAPERQPTVAGVRLRIVQANIDQSLKWRPELRAAHLRTHIELSGRPAATAGPSPSPGPTHVIWPEAAVPFDFTNDAEAAAAAARAVPAGGLLITGASRVAGRPGARRVFNSLHAIDAGATIRATYDKVHLVPFGEYVPLRGILPFDKLVPSQGDLSPGPGRRTLSVDGLPPFAPLICYEAIFPGAVTARGQRPAWLLNVTNDAWFGHSTGPRQHFAAARLRAIEEGLPLVRAANTGISAIIDPYGRITAKLGLGEIGVLDGALPVPRAPTWFARFGNGTALVLLLIVAGLSLVGRRRR